MYSLNTQIKRVIKTNKQYKTKTPANYLKRMKTQMTDIWYVKNSVI